MAHNSLIKKGEEETRIMGLKHVPVRLKEKVEQEKKKSFDFSQKIHKFLIMGSGNIKKL